MNEQAIIFIKGSWAELRGAPESVLPSCLTFLHPERTNSLAFREKRWDGTVPLYEGRRFPAGLCDRVVDACKSLGYDTRILGWKKAQIDLKRFTPAYLPGITLRPHQYELCLAMLTQQRMAGRACTRFGKSFCYLACARYLWEELGWKSLIIVPKKGLLDQMYKAAKQVYGNDVPIGRYGDGWHQAGVVNIATAQTLQGWQPRVHKSKIVQPDHDLRELVLTGHQALFLDEVHRGRAAFFYDPAMASSAPFRIGLSGTPISGEDLYDAKMMGSTGPLSYDHGAQELIATGHACKPKIAMIMADNASAPQMPYTTGIHTNHDTGKLTQYRQYPPYAEAYEKCIINSDTHNRTVIRAAEWMIDHKRGAVIFCRRKSHFITLSKMLQEKGIEFAAVWGAHNVQERNRAKRQFAEKRVKVLLCSEILGEGEDIPGADSLIYAEGIKSAINNVQRLGRGMMLDKNGPKDFWVVVIISTAHPILVAHGLAQCRAFEAEGHEVRLVTSWPDEDEPGFSYNNLLPFLDWDAQPSLT